MRTRTLSTAALVVASALAILACGPAPAPRTAEEAPPASGKRLCRLIQYNRAGPTCSGEITAETAAHLGTSYRLVQENGQAVSLRCVNGAGGPCADPESYTFRYEGGLLVGWQFLNEIGVPYGGYTYTHRPDGKTLRVRRSISGADESIEVLGWDARGFIADRRYVDEAGEPLADQEGVYGIHYTRDAQGDPLATTLVDAGGRPMLNRYSYSGEKWRRDAEGRTVEVARFDLDDRPAHSGIQRTVYEHDAWGNVTKTSCLNHEGKPALDMDQGAFSTEKRDEHGNPIEVRYFGLRGEPFTAPSGEAGYRTDYDASGRRARVTFLDAAGAPTRAGHGYARRDVRYDAVGRPIEERYFDEKGELVITPGGFAILVHRYSDVGDEIVTAYLGPHERPMLRKGLYSAVARVFDGEHRLVGLGYLDERGKPIDIWRGYAGLRYAYDASGKRTRTVHVDSSGAPVEMVKLRMLRVSFQGQGLDVAGVTRSRDEARARAAEALGGIRGGLGFAAAIRLYADDPQADGGGGELAATALQPEESRRPWRSSPRAASATLSRRSPASSSCSATAEPNMPGASWFSSLRPPQGCGALAGWPRSAHVPGVLWPPRARRAPARACATACRRTGRDPRSR